MVTAWLKGLLKDISEAGPQFSGFFFIRGEAHISRDRFWSYNKNVFGVRGTIDTRLCSRALVDSGQYSPSLTGETPLLMPSCGAGPKPPYSCFTRSLDPPCPALVLRRDAVAGVPMPGVRGYIRD